MEKLRNLIKFDRTYRYEHSANGALLVKKIEPHFPFPRVDCSGELNDIPKLKNIYHRHYCLYRWFTAEKHSIFVVCFRYLLLNYKFVTEI